MTSPNRSGNLRANIMNISLASAIYAQPHSTSLVPTCRATAAWGLPFRIRAPTSCIRFYLFFELKKKSVVYMGLTLSVVRSVELDQYMMSFTHHYATTQNASTAPNSVLWLLIPHFHCPTSGNPWFSRCLHCFAFSRRSLRWIHAICRLFRLSSLHSNKHL